MEVWWSLTNLERHTIALMASGYTETELASINGVTPIAIKMRKLRIYAKFGLPKKAHRGDKRFVLTECYSKYIQSKTTKY